MKKLLTFVVLLGLLLSLQVPLVGAQDQPEEQPDVEEQQNACELNENGKYVVQQEETAKDIAAKCGVPSVDDLLAANELESADEIQAGDELVIPEPAEEPTPEPTDEPVDEPTEEPVNPPTEEPVDEPTEEPVDEPTEELVNEPTNEEATPEPTVEPVVEEAPVVASDEVESVAQHPGSYSTQIVAIANLQSSGNPETPVMTLYNIDGGGETPVGTMPAVYPGGVGFVDTGQFATGRYAAVIESTFPAAAVAFTVNSSAKTADTYQGFSEPSQELFATLIFNKHANFESLLYCQNAGSGAASITVDLYKAGDTSPRVSLTANNVAANHSVAWDIADNATVQAQWPGGQDQFGFARFTSANNIACVVDNQRMASPYVQSQYAAVPTSFAGNESYSPLVFHGHGQSSGNSKGLKWNTGVSIVNTTSSSANVTIVYSANNGYQATCTKTLPGNGSANWYMPEVASLGWSCTPNSSLPWSYPGGPTFGSIKVTSTQPILALNNSNRYDGSVLGAGFSSTLAVPTVSSNRLACPLTFNKNAANDWISGVRVVNVGTVTTDVSYKMVRANVNPGAGGNTATITVPGIAPGTGASVYFPEQGSALTGFEGAVFIEASNASARIAATANSTNYNALGAGAQYECVNY